MPEDRLESVIERIGLPSITDFTVTDFDALRKELKKIRAQAMRSTTRKCDWGFSGLPRPCLTAVTETQVLRPWPSILQ